MALKFQDHISHIQSLIDAAVLAADPAKAVAHHLQRDGDVIHVGNVAKKVDSGEIFLISVGKAAIAMGRAAGEILGESLSQGVIITKHNQLPSQDNQGEAEPWPGGIQLFGAGHPISDESSLEATAAAIDLLEQTTARDLVLCLISGGASSLLTQPIIPLDRWQLLVDQLLASGCTINELNSVRKRLDSVKGGGLARIAFPAQCVSLILSDVIGNPLDMIGSGPTASNPDSNDQALRVLERYNLKEILPEHVWQCVTTTLKQSEQNGDQSNSLAENIIVGDVRLASRAAARKAVELGFKATLLTAHLEGEAREVGKLAAALAKDAPEGSALVLGGETTVKLQGDGFGGRNQELALAAAIALEGWPNRVVAGFATDGDDGPTDAAGAIATGDTVSQAHFAGIDPMIYLDNNDSYSFFSEIGGHIRTGPTGTNVNDLVLILHYGS
ncbi:MAG: glycerate kinase [Anaerolineae bacterium]|nr:MAG: glycerate kinase [Anaerolineae bacterium]